MGRWQPYQYNPQRNSDDTLASSFNPKAVTMASRMPTPRKKKQDGPLLSFNKHPDSYLVMPYGHTNAKPMSLKVKDIIKIVRWLQLLFRICNLLGAIGVLLCGIFIRGATDTEGYVLRITPGLDMVVALYAIYHLARNARSRTAASSASYHFFALITDAGFLPFYAFAVLMTRRNLDTEVGATGRWRTTFPTDHEANVVLKSTWLIAAATGGLHIISTFLDMYLLVVFRKISNLPPDLNPLEGNLTSRRKTKHTHKNSSVSTLNDNEKRFSEHSTIAGDRNSQVDPLIEGNIPSPSKTQMAFMHTRKSSEATYSPHTPESARQSKERFSMYSQSASAQRSRGNLNHRDDLHRREEVDEEETLAQRKAYLAQQANIKRHSRSESYITPQASRDHFYAPPASAQDHCHDDMDGDLSVQRINHEELQNDTWFVHQHHDEARQEQHYPALPAQHSMDTPPPKGYESLALYDDVSDLEDDYHKSAIYDKPAEVKKPEAPQPLRMNPPTPPPAQVDKEELRAPSPVSTLDEKRLSTPPPGLKRTHTTTSISTDATFNRSHSRSGATKSRYYGDLQAATHGVRSGNSPSHSPSTSPSKGSFKNQPNHLPSATKQYAVNTPPPAKKNPVNQSPFTLNKKSYTSVRRTGEANHSPVKAESPRVISRSGVDYLTANDTDDMDLGKSGRRRDVSGKVAEEGRGGMKSNSWRGMVHRKVSGVA